MKHKTKEETMHRKRYYLALALVLALGLLVAPSAKADDYYCSGTVYDGYFDNVIVPYGAKCVLKRTTVDGNVMVEERGALVTRKAYIDGSIKAYGAKFVRIFKTYVGGNVQIEKTKGRASKICRSAIYGDVQLFENYVPFEVGCGEKKGNYIGGNLQVEKNYVNPRRFKDFVDYAISIQYNKIEGDLQFFENKSKSKDYTPLDFWIYKNKIYGNLQCYDNYPDPMGDKNFVYGNAEGQCYTLAYGYP